MFIVVADSPRALTGAMWAKSGGVAGWGAFLGNESTNNWSGWFNSTGSVMTGNGVNAAGAVLEGALNVESTFGRIPSPLYIAVGKYATADGGALQAQVPSGNGNGDIEAAEFFAFAADSVLSAPSPPLPVSPPDRSTGQPLSLTLVWNRSLGATSYGVQLSTDSTFTGGFLVNASSLADTVRPVSGLFQTTEYFWRVNARNIGGASAWSPARSFTTLLLSPTQVSLVSPADAATTGTDSILLVWRRAAVGVTGYRLDLSTDPLFTAPATDSSLTDTTHILSGLLPHQPYWWRVRARNAAGWGPVSAVRTFTPLPGVVTRTISYVSGWNMLSNPVTTAGDSVLQLFPASLLTYAFAFDQATGYGQSHSMRNGRGYWLKFGGGGTALLTGQERLADTAGVTAGWNMIGSISSPVSAAGIGTNPPGILGSDFYGFDGGEYSVAATIEPGKAYWVKAHGGGVLLLYPAKSSARSAGEKSKKAR